VALTRRHRLPVSNVGGRDIDHVPPSGRSVISALRRRTRFDSAAFSLYLVPRPQLGSRLVTIDCIRDF